MAPRRPARAKSYKPIGAFLTAPAPTGGGDAVRRERVRARLRRRRDAARRGTAGKD